MGTQLRPPRASSRRSVKIPFSSATDHAPVRPRRVARAEDPIMDDEQARRHGAAGSIAAAAGNGRAGEPRQLVLWSTAPHEETEKRGRARQAAPAAASKFLLIEPAISGAHTPSSRDHAIMG